MAPIKIDIPPSPQGKSSGAHQTSSILCQVIVTGRKSFKVTNCLFGMNMFFHQELRDSNDFHFEW
jgi:hypothetical protein